jgi:hypothetical protein
LNNLVSDLIRVGLFPSAPEGVQTGRGLSTHKGVPRDEEAGLLLWPTALEGMELWSLEFTAESFIPSSSCKSIARGQRLHDFAAEKGINLNTEASAPR